MIRKNTCVAVAIAVSTALALTGCGRSSGDAASAPAAELSGGPATGTVTLWAQGTEGEALADFIKPFEEANPDVTVTVTPIPWDSAQNKYQTAIAGSTTPDIGMFGTDWMPGFASALLPTPAQIDTSGIFPVSVETTEFDGEAYGVPWYVETRVIFYRSDLMKEAGFEEFPTTFDGLKELAQAYKDKAGADYGISLPTSGWNAFLSLLPFAWSNDAAVISDDQTEWTFDTPEMEDSFEYLNSFFTEELADKNPDTESSARASAFIDGSVPMFLSGPWDIPGLTEAGGEGFGDKFSVATIPASSSGTSTSFAAGANLAVFKAAKNPDAAWKLIQWLTEPDVQADWFEAVNDLPAQEVAWNDPALSENTKVSVFGDQLQSTKTAPPLTSWTQVSAAADTEVEQMIRGGKTPAEALAQIQSTADSLGTGK